MNKLKKQIFKYGKVVGVGSSRVALFYDSKVFKIPYRPFGITQSKVEQSIYSHVPIHFQGFFPNPVFRSNGIVELDLVSSVDTWLGSWSDSPLDDIIAQNLIPSTQLNLFLDLLQWLSQELDIDELLYNGGNLGFKNDQHQHQHQLQIIDWGFDNHTSRGNISIIGSPVEYSSMRSKIADCLFDELY